MSIATVVTAGYGSFGSVNLLPTLGYGAGAAIAQPTPSTAPAVAPDRGFDQYMEAFARERALEKRRRENEEIMKIAAMEEEFLLGLIKRILH